MATYVLSDVHGMANKLKCMLDKISFSKDDKLYILGDIFDRGPNPLGVLDIILKNRNIELLMGNHEKFFLDYYINNDKRLWLYNGGASTLFQIEEMKKKNKDFEKQLYDYISSLKTLVILDEDFILTHAAIYLPKNCNDYDINQIVDMQTSDYNLWSRDNILKERKYKNYKIIVGHTPVQTIVKDMTKILVLNNTFYIDCGAVFGGKLACLRLDDMKRFYA